MSSDRIPEDTTFDLGRHIIKRHQVFGTKYVKCQQNATCTMKVVGKRHMVANTRFNHWKPKHTRFDRYDQKATLKRNIDLNRHNNVSNIKPFKSY